MGNMFYEPHQNRNAAVDDVQRMLQQKPDRIIAERKWTETPH